MFKSAIKNNSKFLMPFLQGIKLYGSDEILSNVGCMIIVNRNGTLLTCKHIASEICKVQDLFNSYSKLLKKVESLNELDKEKFLRDNGIFEDTCVLSVINWFFEVKNESNIQIIFHPFLDLALIKFEGVNFDIDTYPIFSLELPEQGQSICKLGYAFSNIDVFEYDHDNESIRLKENGNMELPLFPLDGIVTRHINFEDNNVSGAMFETSTLGLRGQSGGPVFSPDGVIYGIQSLTSYVDLGFEINCDEKKSGKTSKVGSVPYMGLGIAVSSKEVIKFLEDNNVEFKAK